MGTTVSGFSFLLPGASFGFFRIFSFWINIWIIRILIIFCLEKLLYMVLVWFVWYKLLCGIVN